MARPCQFNGRDGTGGKHRIVDILPQTGRLKAYLRVKKNWQAFFNRYDRQHIPYDLKNNL
jgi:hypothetical protein